MAKETDIARGMIDALGGKENIATLAFCMTRVRVTPVNGANVDKTALKQTAGVLGLVEAGAELQIILGPGVAGKVAREMADITGLKMGEVKDYKASMEDRNRTPFKQFLRTLASIFVPLIPAIVGSGLIAGITNIIVRMGVFDPKSTVVTILNFIGWSVFSYLAIMVGINTAKEFGGTPALGAIAGIFIINPGLANITLFGEKLVVGRGGLIGALLTAMFMAWLEKRIRRYIPNALDILLTPALTILITGAATLIIIQPFGGAIANGITKGVQDLLQVGGPLVGAILAGTFLPIVMTGLHHGLVPIHMELINKLHQTPLLPILAMAGAGQVGATIAVYIKTKNARLKEVIKGALPVGILGIGEPLIFGVTLPLGKPFVTACLGATVGGAYQAVMKVGAVAMGVSGLPLTFLVTDIPNYLIGICLAYLGGFVVTYLLGFEDPEEF